MDIAAKPADVSLAQQHLQADIPNPAKKNSYSIKELARLTSAGGRKLLLPGKCRWPQAAFTRQNRPAPLRQNPCF
jgi:hypothetical protein